MICALLGLLANSPVKKDNFFVNFINYRVEKMPVFAQISKVWKVHK